MPRSKTLLTILLLAFGGVAATYLFGSGDDPLLKDTAYLLFPLIATWAGFCAVKAYGLKSASGRALLYMTAGFGAWTAGELIWYWFKDFLGIDPFPSIADVFYLLGYPLILVGLLKSFRLAGIKPGLLDKRALVLGIGAILLLGVVVGYFGIYLAYAPEVSLAENLIAMSYGVADLVLIAASLLMLMLASVFKGGRLASFWGLVLFGVVTVLIADILFAIYNEPYVNDVAPYVYMDLLWVFGDLLFAYGFFGLAFSVGEIQEKLRAAVSSPAVSSPKGN